MFLRRLRKLIQIILNPKLFSALVKGSAAATEHISVLEGCNFDFIVDVGANRGQFALIARKIFPKAKILSFEPLEEPAKIFKQIFADDPNILLYPYAIGREKMTSTIHITKQDHSSSLLPITKTQSTMFPDSIEKDTRRVNVLPLTIALGDTPIPSASLLKIDVQGFELEVLIGCEDILGKFSHLLVECSFIELYAGQALAHQVISWLEDREFFLSGISDMYYDRDGKAVYGDFFFTRDVMASI
jgi:FkbM family methyltransferase